jgi:transcriptional regulator with XRE-family HTH domain
VARGTSQERLAADAGLERRHVGAIERGEENPTVATLDRIAAALGIDITDLFARPKLGATLAPGLPPGRRKA